jgi:streptomycin 6-kinase
MITIPEAFARDTVTREREAGRKWLADLPGLVDSLCRQWQLVIDGAPMHGYLGLVIPVRRGSEACVLKVSWIDETTQTEAAALAAWQGQGAVQMLAAAPDQGALLLERLAQRRLVDLPIAAALSVAGRLLRQLAIPTAHPFPQQSTLVWEIQANLPARWERYGRPLPRSVVDQAVTLAQQHSAAHNHLLVNYDLHYENILAGGREPWLAIDPKVVVGDPEFGIAQLLVNRQEEIEAQGGLDHHFQILTEAAELDPDLARIWTLVRCVDYWLWGLSVGLTEDPVRCARMVDWSIR